MATKKPKKIALSPGQKKLVSLGIKLPQIPMTTTGSFPKQSELLELKYRVIKGFQQPSELERKERLAIDHWIRFQENLGLDVIVDGEINRGDFVNFFAGKISGFETGGYVRCYGNRYYRKPIIKKKLEWKGPLIVDAWKQYQRATHKPLKAILTGPTTLMDWSFNEFYTSRHSTLQDLTRVIRKEVQMLSSAGAKIIQIDDPALSSRPDEFPMILDAYQDITANLKSYFVLHHSYGDITPLWQKMQRLPFDNFSIETVNTNYTFLSLLKKIPTKKDLTLGVIDSHRHDVESPKIIQERIRLIRRHVPINQLWLSPDCGLKTRTPEETLKKLNSLVKTVTAIRPKI